MGPILQVAALAASSWVVSAPVANMYSAPDPTAPVVSQVIHGVTVTWLEARSGWVQIETPDHYRGWVEQPTLHRIKGAPYASSGRVARVESLFAKLYAEPDITTQPPLLTLPFESQLEVVAEPDDAEGRWIEVRLADGGRAWIQRGDISFDKGITSIDETLALSRRFIGLPYLWGGTSSFGFDCSGFTQMLYRQMGIHMPRDAHMQAAWDELEPVDCSSRLPGDLLFFGESAEKITHTGMYVGGDEFVHATAFRRPRVQVSSLNEPRWSGLLVGCRRSKKEQK